MVFPIYYWVGFVVCNLLVVVFLIFMPMYDHSEFEICFVYWVIEEKQFGAWF